MLYGPVQSVNGAEVSMVSSCGREEVRMHASEQSETCHLVCAAGNPAGKASKFHGLNTFKKSASPISSSTAPLSSLFHQCV